MTADDEPARPGLISTLRELLGPGAIADDPERHLVDVLGRRGAPAVAVVLPATTEEVSAVVRLCRERGVAIVPRGGNTGFVRGAQPVAGRSRPTIVLSTDRMTAEREVDPAAGTMTLEAGVTLGRAREIATAHDRLFPIAHGGMSSTIGGMVSTNAGGNAVIRYGMARASILGLEAVLADGTVWDGLSKLAKANRGLDAKQLFIASEGTLGVVTAAVLRLWPAETHVATALAAVPTAEAAVRLLGRARDVLGDLVTAFELMPRSGLDLVSAWRPTPEPFAARHTWVVLVEVAAASRFTDLDGALEAALGAATEAGEVLDAVVATSEARRRSLWALREGLALAQVETPGNLKNDTAVPVSAIPAFIDAATAEVARLVPGAVPIPFGHVGDGNIHFNVNPPLGADPEAFTARWPELVAAIEEVAVAHGGTFSAEHGIGADKLSAAARHEPAAGLALARRVKQALDPDGLLNPGKVYP